MTITLPALPETADRRRFFGLALGSAGVVYGDIGTSPLYAFKESIHHLNSSGIVAAADVFGVVSLMFWALMIIVTLKYVLIVMRFDNRGEGGTLALMALVQRAGGRALKPILLIGMLGAALFFGDALLTPAISVLSAVEGLKVIGGLDGHIDPFITPIALAILIGLFAVQKHGTGGIGRWFGPICLIWFVVLAALGVSQIVQQPQILRALNPAAGMAVLFAHPWLATAILGSVFLTVTGAEALYADMGHFGRGPIKAAWLGLVFPCLTLNYLGQGALVLGDAAAASSPFFLMAPAWLQLPLVVLATAATVIASQAVISGAYSLAQQATQLGLLPRMIFKPTSKDHAGQIYAPQINWILMIGVTALVLAFKSSSALASAYGVSVVGAMITSSILAVVAIQRLLKKPIWLAVLLFSPFLAIEAVFTGANLSKVAHGGYVPLLLAAALMVVMLTWMRGARALKKAEANNIALSELLAMLKDRPPMRARGTAVFLTADPAVAPVALMHNLKHNQVLHEQVVMLTVRFSTRPHVPASERIVLTDLAPGVRSLVLLYGFMESPDVSQAMNEARRLGMVFDMMTTSFFLSRRTLMPSQRRGLGRHQDWLFLYLMRNAVRAADFFHIPPARVVELGAQVTV